MLNFLPYQATETIDINKTAHDVSYILGEKASGRFWFYKDNEILKEKHDLIYGLSVLN